MQNNVLKNKSFLVLDLGSKQLGYAVYDSASEDFVERGSSAASQNQGLSKVLALLESFPLEVVAVGFPLRVDGGLTEQAKDVLQFCRRLSRRSKVAIFLVDEFQSTLEAERRLGADLSLEKRKKVKKMGALDSQSAVIIGERFLRDEVSVRRFDGLEEEFKHSNEPNED